MVDTDSMIERFIHNIKYDDGLKKNVDRVVEGHNDTRLNHSGVTVYVHCGDPTSDVTPIMGGLRFNVRLNVIIHHRSINYSNSVDIVPDIVSDITRVIMEDPRLNGTCNGYRSHQLQDFSPEGDEERLFVLQVTYDYIEIYR